MWIRLPSGSLLNLAMIELIWVSSTEKALVFCPPSYFKDDESIYTIKFSSLQEAQKAYEYVIDQLNINSLPGQPE